MTNDLRTQYEKAKSEAVYVALNHPDRAEEFCKRYEELSNRYHQAQMEKLKEHKDRIAKFRLEGLL